MGPNVVQGNARMERHDHGAVGFGMEAEDRLVGDDAVRAAAAQAELFPALPADITGAGEMGDGSGKLALLVPHDDEDAPGERRHVIAAGAAVEIALAPVVLLEERGVN